MKIPNPPPKTIIYELPADEQCLAKTRKVGEHIEKGCDIFTHLAVTEQIVEELGKVFQGTPRAFLFNDEFRMVHWLAALHDIGKMTPVFQRRIYESLGETLPGYDSSYPHIDISHAYCSEVILTIYGKVFAELAGAHHGSAATTNGLGLLRKNDPLLGGDIGIERRQKMVDRLKKELNLPDFQPKHVTNLPEDLVLGAVILADWLSSSMDIPFNVWPTRKEISQVVSESGFSPIRLRKTEELENFERIFGFPPNDFQKVIGENSHRGHVYIVESEMGSGKTEAALYLASKRLATGEANGIYFALPTKLTSEKIFSRLEAFLNQIVPAEPQQSAILIHGQSWIDWMSNRDERTNTYEDGQLPNSFFLSKKRALLAPFAAGTIDQALLSVINVKHSALRAFGLSGKVVIIDEVHSYDTYTGSLIESLVKSLEEWGCTVIILSATLTRSARASLLGKPEWNTQGSHDYPLLTIKEEDGSVKEKSLPRPKEKSVQIRCSQCKQDCLSEALEKAYNGQQVLWIENTVDEAQDVFKKLSADAASIEVGLIHSRFPACVREQNENYWTNIYGKNGAAERVKKGRILVGTQVLEQSIDIDADFLITQLAPSDMLLQRIGRLWRHPSLNGSRAQDAQCEVMILCEKFVSNRYNDKGFLPYDTYTINRSYEVWGKKTQIILPDEIRSTLEETYADRQEEGSLATLKSTLEIKKRELKLLAGKSQAKLSRAQSDDDDLAVTRLNDEPTVDVLLLARSNRGEDYRKVIHSPFLKEGIVIPPRDAPWKDKEKAIRALTRCLIRVRESLAPAYEDFEIEFLSHLLWTGNQDFRPLRAAFVHDGGKLVDFAGNPSHFGKKPFQLGKNLTYNGKIGYSVI